MTDAVDLNKTTLFPLRSPTMDIHTRIVALTNRAARSIQMVAMRAPNRAISNSWTGLL